MRMEHATVGLATVYLGDCRDIIRSIDLPQNTAWVYDPPWDAAIPLDVGRPMIAFCDGMRQRDLIEKFGAPTWIFTWDCVSSWFTPNRPLRRAKYALWYGDIAEYNFDGAHYGADRSIRARIVENSRGAYVFRPDDRGRHLSDVFSAPITRIHRGGHHHGKPLDWVRMLIANCLGRRCVIDPFAGGGSTAVACNEIGVPSISVELDRVNYEMIIHRLSAQSRPIISGAQIDLI